MEPGYQDCTKESEQFGAVETKNLSERRKMVENHHVRDRNY